MKGLGKQLLRVRNVSGAAVLETGAVVPVLNVAELMRSAGADAVWCNSPPDPTVGFCALGAAFFELGMISDSPRTGLGAASALE